MLTAEAVLYPHLKVGAARRGIMVKPPVALGFQRTCAYTLLLRADATG
jgi:hypothetical protein